MTAEDATSDMKRRPLAVRILCDFIVPYAPDDHAFRNLRQGQVISGLVVESGGVLIDFYPDGSTMPIGGQYFCFEQIWRELSPLEQLAMEAE